MTDFAKIFQISRGQVLFTTEYDTDDSDSEQFSISCRVADHKGITPATTFTYDTEADRDKFFSDMDQSDAEKIAGELHTIIDRFSA